MDYLFTAVSLLGLVLIVFSVSYFLTYKRENIHFIGIVISMAAVGVIYSILISITDILPTIITIATLTSLLGHWSAKSFHISKRLAERIEKQLE